MSHAAPRSQLGTHEVFNQPDPLLRDPWADDIALRSIVGEDPELAALGAALGAQSTRDAARDAQTRLPELRTFDRSGRRIDEVHFHPGYHQLMTLGLEAGYAATAWDGTGSHLRHSAINYMLSQVEPGVCCPMTMTYAAVPAMAADPDLAALWQPKLTARAYDPSRRAVGQKEAATLGMAMTEKRA